VAGPARLAGLPRKARQGLSRWCKCDRRKRRHHPSRGGDEPNAPRPIGRASKCTAAIAPHGMSSIYRRRGARAQRYDGSKATDHGGSEIIRNLSRPDHGKFQGFGCFPNRDVFLQHRLSPSVVQQAQNVDFDQCVSGVTRTHFHMHVVLCECDHHAPGGAGTTGVLRRSRYEGSFAF